MHASTPATTVAVAMAVSTIVAIAISPQSASAAAIPRSWTGTTSTDWTLAANWSPNEAPSTTSRSAVFDTAFTNQPTVPGNSSSIFGGIGGVWVKGTAVGDINIGVSPTVNGSTRTFQVHSLLNDVDDAAILIDSGTTGKLTINTTSLKLGDAQSWVNNSSNVFTVNASVNVNSLAFTIKGSGDTVINGATTGGGTLTKDGDGILTFAGATHGHSGTTVVTAGTLRVTSTLSNSSAVLNANGGTVDGTGTIGRTTTVASEATLAPGISNTTAGTLTFNRSLTLQGTTDFDLFSPASYDKIYFSGTTTGNRTLTYNGTLKVDGAGVSFANGQVYDLFDWGVDATRTGAFTTVQLPTLPSGLTWKIFGSQAFDYTTGQIVVVPEPLGVGAFGAAMTTFMLRRRRRQGAVT